MNLDAVRLQLRLVVRMAMPLAPRAPDAIKAIPMP